MSLAAREEMEGATILMFVMHKEKLKGTITALETVKRNKAV